MANNFDKTQFANRKEYPVNARRTMEGWVTPGIAFEDYARMSTQQRKPSGERRLPTPDWSVNDTKLRDLLVAFMEERAGFRKQQKGTLSERLERAKLAVINQRPRLVAVLDKLCNEYVTLKRLGLNPDSSDKEWNESRLQPYIPCCEGEARFVAEKKRKRELEIEIEGLDTYLRYTANGGADVIAAIVFLYYRVGLDSVGVGAELSLKPPHVRQTLWRLFQTASKLWPKHIPVMEAAASKETIVNPKTSGDFEGAGLDAAPLFGYY
jgi:hypothetical protein